MLRNSKGPADLCVSGISLSFPTAEFYQLNDAFTCQKENGRLQRIVVRNMSIDETLDELDLQLKGTTVSAFVFKDGIKLGVDSRESNEWVRKRNERWKPTIRNTAVKWFEVSKQIIGIMAGSKSECLKLRLKVTKMADALKSTGGKIDVSAASDFVYNYLNGLRNEKNSFGIVIAGYDETKGFQIYRLFLKGNELCQTKVQMLASLGTGATYANHNIVYQYDFNLSNDDATQLVHASIFNSLFFDKNSGGDIRVFHVRKDKWVREESLEALQAYSTYYEQYDEGCLLFIVYSDKYQVVTADKMIAHFRPHGDIVVAHCVDHRRPHSQKQGFYFHRLVFVSNEEAAKAFRYVEKNHFPNKFKITSKLPYRLLLDDNTPLFVIDCSCIWWSLSSMNL